MEGQVQGHRRLRHAAPQGAKIEHNNRTEAADQVNSLGQRHARGTQGQVTAVEARCFVVCHLQEEA